MATVTIVLRKDKINKKGEAPIHFRIIKNRKPSYLASGYMIPIDKWDEKNKRVKPGVKNSGRLNSYITKKFTIIQDSVLEDETNSRSYSTRNLRDRVFGRMPVSFFSFAEQVVQQYEKIGAINTYRRSLSTLKKLKTYSKNNSLTFQDITIGYLLNYENYCRDSFKNKTNTIHKDMKFLRKIFNDAIRQDIIGLECSPLKKYQMKTEKTTKEYLTEEELKTLENYPAKKDSRIELHRDMFIFAAYNGGLRISDVLKLKRKEYDGSHLNILVKKTSTPLSIKVTNKGKEIIKKYIPSANSNDSFIFPMLPANIDVNNPEELTTAISSASAYINKNLKIIANAVGIEKNVSFHISRHSFAVMALRKGISIDKVSKLMAHANIRETQIYAKVVNEDLDKAMDSFNI